MALINLKYIGDLALEGRLAGSMCESDLFNWDSKRRSLTDQEIVVQIKTGKQSENLFRALKRLHQTCFDFVADNHAPYVTEWAKYQEDETDVYDPFWFLTRDFKSDSIHDLPQTIAQYAELVSMSTIYVKLQEVKSEGLAKFFPGIRKNYLIKDEAGNNVMVPESDIPQDIRDGWAAQKQIERIEAEFCLDGYNEFYKRVITSVEMCKPYNDVKGCAEFILSQFAPVAGAKLTEA